MSQENISFQVDSGKKVALDAIATPTDRNQSNLRS